MRRAFIIDNDDGDKLQVMELGENVMISIKRNDHEMGMVLNQDQWLDLMELRYRIHFTLPVDDSSVEEL